jgi:RNA polymerase sigma factor (sigma-70 family)
VSAFLTQMSVNASLRKQPVRATRVAPLVRAVETARVEGELEERIFSLVYRQMNALWGRWRADFDDLVQTASEQAVRSLPSFRHDSELSTWTYKICYRTAMRHRRWSARWLGRFSLDSPEADAADRSTSASQRLEEAERAQRMRRALDRLSHKLRAVIVLRDLEGLESREVAEIVGASEATVRSRLRDGRRRLADFLKADPYFWAEVCRKERS